MWRLVKKVGAVLYRNSVYVLPDGKERLEDFQWLCQQIRDAKGEASVFATEARDAAEDRTLRALFVHDSDEEYAALLTQAQRLAERLRRARDDQRLSERLLNALGKEARQLNESFAEAQRTDFFGAPLASKTRGALEQVGKLLGALLPQSPVAAPPRRHQRKEFQGKTWATRQHIHIDRLCSAWLIRRFIDPKAKFVFAPESKLPKDAIAFDAFGVEFSHHGEDCTFETLVKSFGLKDAALRELAETVHDIDMKDQKFGRAEAAGLDLVVRALGNTLRDDQKVLTTGSTILDALYSHLSKGS